MNLRIKTLKPGMRPSTNSHARRLLPLLIVLFAQLLPVAARCVWAEENPAAPAAAAPSGVAAVVPPAPAAPGTAAEERLALVIGNSSYRDTPLANPANDARAMAFKLKELGFRVIEKEDASLEEMRKSVRDFGNQIALGGVGLFYYAGHGVQSNGVNYLIPVDADIQDETELTSRAFAATEVLEKMDSAKNRINIMILDACNNNPLVRKIRSATNGLAIMQQGSGTIVEFATKPGSTAADGEGSHGLYSDELLQALSQQGLSIEEVFKQVRMEVSRKSGGAQIPWENSSLMGEFYFNPLPGQEGPRLAYAATSRSFGQQPLPPTTKEALRVLLPRRLLENYQLAANLALSAPPLIGAFMADERHYMLVTQDRQLQVIDASTGNVVFSHAGMDAPTASPDGRYVVGVADDRFVNVFDLTNETYALRTYHGVRDVQAAWISPNGQRVVVAHAGTVSVLKLETDTPAGPPIKFEGELHLQFSPAGNRAVISTSSASRGGELLLLDVDSGKRVGRTNSHNMTPSLVRFSPDGTYFLSAAEGDAAYVWRSADGQKMSRLALGDKSPLPSQAEFISDGKQLLLNVAELAKDGGTHNRFGFWDVLSGRLGGTLLPDAVVRDLRFSPDRQQLYLTTNDRSIRVYDLSTKSLRTTISGAELVGVSPDGARLVASEGDGLRLYAANTLAPVARMPGQVAAFIAPKTNGVFATAANDGSLRLWEFENGDPVSVLKGHLDTVQRVSFADGGKRLVSFTKERVAKVWGLPEVEDADKLRKDTYESTAEYQKRVAEWSSPFTALVELGEYNADAETYAVRVGDYSFPVPVPRADARRLGGQREAILQGKLTMFDSEQLQLADGKLERLP
jgi:WD40 repeat protein